MPRARVGSVATVVALATALVMVVALALHARSWKDRYRDLFDRATAVHPGMYVPVWRVAALGGDTVVLGSAPADGYEVLFFFTTTCPYCRASIPAWNRIADAARSAGVAAYGLQLDSSHLAAQYVEDRGVRFEVIPEVDLRLVRLYRVPGVPLTVVVNGEGRVVHARRGEITETTAIDSIIAAFRPDPGAAAAALSVLTNPGGTR